MRKTLLLTGLTTLPSLAMAEICRFDDDRVHSYDSRVGRSTLASEFDRESRKRCTIALIGKNCFVTSASCTKHDTVEFNVPLSVQSMTVNASPENTYKVNSNSWMIPKEGGVLSPKHENWAVGKLLKNETTGRNAGDVNGFFAYQKTSFNKGLAIKIPQFGKTNPTRWHVRAGYEGENPYGHELNYAQSVGTGVVKKLKKVFFSYKGFFDHNIDTNHGSVGAPIINAHTDELIGVTTHGGCKPTGNRRSHRGQRNPGEKWQNGANSIYGDKAFQQAIKTCISNDF